MRALTCYQNKLTIAAFCLLTYFGLTTAFSGPNGIKPAPTPYYLAYDSTLLGTPTLPYYNPLTVQGVQLGRLLFYDTLLSANNKQSCASCHKQELSFSDGRKLAVGAHGDTLNRNTMSLVNLAWQSHFFWDGRKRSLEELIPEPITKATELGESMGDLVNELKAHPYYPKLFEKAFPDEGLTEKTIAKAIAQFLRTITSNGVYVPDSMSPKKQILHNASFADTVQQVWATEKSTRGMFVRVANSCSPCHGGPSYGGLLMAVNGVNDTAMPMMAPSLINITLTGPYMHDGRFSSLKQVLLHYREHISGLYDLNKGVLFQPIKASIIDYDIENGEKLFSLFADSTLLTNPAYSNPFKDPSFKWQ
jgi:cytochrome c peroxidase